jgi:hypothetical protein
LLKTISTQHGPKVLAKGHFVRPLGNHQNVYVSQVPGVRLLPLKGGDYRKIIDSDRENFHQLINSSICRHAGVIQWLGRDSGALAPKVYAPD